MSSTVAQPEERMFGKDDFVVIQALVKRCVYLCDIARQLGVHPKTVSRALAQGRTKPDAQTADESARSVSRAERSALGAGPLRGQLTIADNSFAPRPAAALEKMTKKAASWPPSSIFLFD
jgi:hypothetical protein